MADSTHNPLPEPRARWLALAGIVAALAGIITALFARARFVTRTALVTNEPEEPMAAASLQKRTRHVASASVPANGQPVSPRRTFTFIILTILVALVLIGLQNDASPLAIPVFIAVVIGALILAVSRLVIRPTSPAVKSEAPSSVLTQHSVPSTQHLPSNPVSPLRTFAFIILTILVALVLIGLQNDASSLAVPVFIAVLIGAVILAVASSPAPIRHILLTPALTIGVVYRHAHALWKSLVAVLYFYRYRIAALTAFGSLGLMMLSSYAFQIARINRAPLNEPVKYMLLGGVAIGISIFFARPNVALPALPTFQIRVLAHVNIWITGLGIGVLLFLAEIDGKATGTQRLYPIDTDAQFWLLVLGISLVVMGLSGWQPVLRLPPLKWRVFLLGFVLVVGSLLLGGIVERLPFLSASHEVVTSTFSLQLPILGTLQFTITNFTWIGLVVTFLNGVLFWTVRLGDVMILWAVVSGSLKLPPIAFNRRIWVPIVGLIATLAFLSQPVLRNGLAQSLDTPIGLILWLSLLIFIGVVWWFKFVSRRSILFGLGTLIALYILASLSGTILLDLAFALAVNQSFWVLMAVVNFIRVPIAAIYRRLIDEQPEAPASPTFQPDAQDAELNQQSSLVPQPFRSRMIHYTLLVTIVLVALFARFYLLNDTMRFLIDEESFIGATHYLRAVPTMEILAPFSSIAAFPYMYPYFQMHTIDVFGRTLEGLRATSAIMGVLGVLALYFLARTLFDRKVALLAALFLAVLPVHLQFSRIAISEIASPFFGTLAFAFIGRGLLHGRRTDFAIGGALLGLTHYFHEGGRLLYTPLTIAWVVACLLFAVRDKMSSPNVGTRHAISFGGGDRWRNLLIAFAALVIVAAPIYYTLIAIHRPIFARMVDNNSGLGGNYWQSLSNPVKLNEHIQWHLLPAFQVYVNQVDNTLFYADENAFILPALIPIFLLGVFYAAWRWRAPGMLLLLMWLLSTSIGNSLMVDSAGSPRYVMVFPALALACAVGLRYGIPLLVRHVLRARVLMVVAAIGFAFVQMNYYFNDHLPAYNTIFRAEKANPDGYDAALRSADFPSGTNIHIISKNLFSQIEAVGMLGLLRDNLYLDTITPADFNDEYIGELRCRVDQAFFIERTDFRTLDKLRTYFYLRDAQLTPYDDFLPGQRLILFYAPYLKGTEKAYDRKC